MLWRHLCLVRAWSAAGLLSGMMLLGGSAATAQSPAPAPAAARAEPSAPPAEVTTETVDLLQAGKAGDLTVAARGQGQDKVRMTLRNTTERRLNVIVPPGLVAASKVAQAGGGGGGRGGLQSIGLGSVANREGAFGEFQADAPAGGLRSIPTTGEPRSRSVAVPAGETVDAHDPRRLPQLRPARPDPPRQAHPHGRGRLHDRPADPQGAPQPRHARHQPRRRPGGHVAALQRPAFEVMMEQSGKVMNLSEIALAARFVEALDESTSPDLLESSALTESRILVQVEGQGTLARDAQRLNGQLDGLRVLGLPLKVVEGDTLPPCSAPALAFASS